MYEWIMNMVMFILGGGVMFLVLTFTNLGSTTEPDGDLQVYVTDDGLYPVLALNKEETMLNKAQILLDVKIIESRK